jgi:hypothetical protein
MNSMNYLLYNGYYVPATDQIGFIEGDLDEITQGLLKGQGDYVIKNLHGSLDVGLNKFFPVEGPYLQTLLTETKSKWVALFSEHGDVGTKTVGTAKYMHRKCILITYVESTYNKKANDGRYGVSTFAIRTYDSEKLAIRYVSTYQDFDGWVFEQGENVDILPFEKSEYYVKRKKKDRLPPELLAEYCEYYGIHPFDVSFYGLSMRYAIHKEDISHLEKFDRNSFEIQKNMYNKSFLSYNAYHKKHGLQYGRLDTIPSIITQELNE